MTKRTTAKIAKLAARILDGGKYNKLDVLALAGSALAQAERDEGAVKAWGHYDSRNDKITWASTMSRNAANQCKYSWERVIPVEIRRIDKAKRGK